MASNYTGDPDGETDTLLLMTGGDTPTAQLFRVPLERLLDNDAARRRDVARSSNVVLERALLRFQALDVTVDDTAESLGAITTGFGGDSTKPTLVVKVDSTGVVLAHDDSVIDQGGPLASITSLVADCAASTAGRAVAIGVGGQRNAYTDNDGGTWSAGGNGVAGAVQFIVYDGIGDQFLCGGSGTGSVYRSPDASTDWTSAASQFSQPFGLAVLGLGASSGDVVCLGNLGSEPRFSVSTDAGASFSTAGTTPPANAADADEPGDLRGCQTVLRDDLGSSVYHIMRCDSGARIRTNTSQDGLTWTAGTVITAPTGAAFDSRPRLLIDQVLGLFVIVAPLDNGTTALYASRDFVSWTGPAAVRSLATAAWALAGGRLFCTRDDAIYASDSARY